MSTRLAAFIALALCACAKHEVDVGEVGAEAADSAVIDLTSCYGERTRCELVDSHVATFDVPDELAPCPLDAAHPQLELSWEALAPMNGLVLAFAADEVWVAGHQSQSPQIAIERYTLGGELISHTDVPVGADHDVAYGDVRSIDLDARGHAFLAVSMNVQDRATNWSEIDSNFILELDSDGERIGDPIDVPAVNDVVLDVGEDGALILAASRKQRFATLGRVDAERTLTWVQARTRQSELRGLAGDERGRVLALGRTPDPDLGPLESLVMFDPDGNWQWEVRTPFDYPSFVPSRHGGAFVMGDVSFLEDDVAAVQIAELDDTGVVRWSKRFETELQAWDVIRADGSDNLYFSDEQAVHRVDRDGACTKMRLPPDISSPVLYVAPDGSLFITNATGDELGTRFGRIEPSLRLGGG